jgi:ornithine--oxo-acid transaminase
MKQLRRIDSPLISEVRGRGLFIGLEIDPSRGSARRVCELLMSRGVLSKETHETVVRLTPPLVISPGEIDVAVGKISDVIGEMDRIRVAS